MPASSQPGRSTRARRDRARAGDRSRGGAAVGVFLACCLGVFLWARRIVPFTAGFGLLRAVATIGVVLVGGLAIVVRLDLTASTNELSRRLRLERRVARRLRAAGIVVLHDRCVADSAVLSHLVVTGPRSVVVLVDGSCARWAPWRRTVTSDHQSRPVWQAWVDASAGALGLQAALAGTTIGGRTPSVTAAVVTDVRALPPWAGRHPVYGVDQLPGVLLTDEPGSPAPPDGAGIAALATRLAELTGPAEPSA